MKKIKFLLPLFCLFFLSISVNAQSIKIKKGIVYVDGTECLKIETNAISSTISDLEGNELVFLKFINQSKYGKYQKVTFLEEGKSFTSQSFTFTRKVLIKKMIKDGTIEDCQLLADKIDKFVMKYDEAVEKED